MLRHVKELSFRAAQEAHQSRQLQLAKIQLQELYEDYVVHPHIRRETFHRMSQKLHQHRKSVLALFLLLFCTGNLSHDADVVSKKTSRSLSPFSSLHRAGDKNNVVHLAIMHHLHHQRQQQQQQEQNTNDTTAANITAAVCYKTIFGGDDIDVGLIIQWAAYNRLLGFDHVFMWYRPEMETVPRFDELQALPFVTLTLNTKGKRKDYYQQWKTEKMCLSEKEFAASYDWAFLADVDEFLWFPEQIGVKDFLQRYHQNMTYLSFGKQMYTLDHRVATKKRSKDEEQWIDYRIHTTSGHEWPVSHYPFYLPHFCYSPTRRRRGNSQCPTWKGRAKVMVKPSHHQKVDVHGNIARPDPKEGAIHFNTDTVAHVKEWPGIFSPHNTTLRPSSESFSVYHEFDVHIHNLWRAFKPSSTDANGTNAYLMQHDTSLEEWFDYVKSRASL